jgi:hypothetical protein
MPAGTPTSTSVKIQSQEDASSRTWTTSVDSIGDRDLSPVTQPHLSTSNHITSDIVKPQLASTARELGEFHDDDAGDYHEIVDGGVDDGDDRTRSSGI